MPRLFRMYGKKRGDRRTGSQALGSVGEALFFGFFFLVGVVSLILLLGEVIIPEWRANHDFMQSKATVIDTRIDQQGDQYRPAVLLSYLVDDVPREHWGYDIVRSYAGGNEGRESAQQQISAFHKGDTLPCWYDPRQPHHVVVVRGFNGWLWVLLLVPAAFIGISVAGLVYTKINWGKSAEHRAVAAGRAAELNPLGSASATAKTFPTIPLDANITNSPGMRLKYRLPINISQGLRLLALAAACLFWNAMVLVFAMPVLRGTMSPLGHWLLIACLLPFVGVGIALIYYFIRQFYGYNGAGTTALEISDHPLVAGMSYEVLIVQAGHLRMKTLAVYLACEEEATYRQGTDVRSERRRVYQQPLFLCENFEIEPAQPFEQRGSLNIPASAMHSFKADSNEVQWKLVVKGAVEGWPPFDRSFPVIVYPAGSVAKISDRALVVEQPTSANPDQPVKNGKAGSAPDFKSSPLASY